MNHNDQMLINGEDLIKEYRRKKSLMEVLPGRIWSFVYKLRRAISWGIFMFKNSWYDYAFMKDFMDKKLAEMEIMFREKGISLNHYSYAQIIKLARKYLKMSQPEYWDKRQDNFMELVEKKYGKHKIVFLPIDDGMSEMQSWWGGKENERALTISCRYNRYIDYLQRKYYSKFWKLMDKHIGNFWD